MDIGSVLYSYDIFSVSRGISLIIFFYTSGPLAAAPAYHLYYFDYAAFANRLIYSIMITTSLYDRMSSSARAPPAGLKPNLA